MSSLHVLVIGGGPGGLCLAQGLKKAGASLGVYERDRAPTSRLQGYRVHIKITFATEGMDKLLQLDVRADDPVNSHKSVSRITNSPVRARGCGPFRKDLHALLRPGRWKDRRRIHRRELCQRRRPGWRGRRIVAGAPSVFTACPKDRHRSGRHSRQADLKRR